jgi:hypothetical protein
MLEHGIVRLVNANPLVASLCSPNSAGFYESLAKDKPLPGWTYRTINDDPVLTLKPYWGFVKRKLQIDVFANTGGDCQKLARAIDWVLNCYSGYLPDEDHTQIFDCFRSDTIDVPLDPITRRYCRILEYEVDFFDARQMPEAFGTAVYGVSVYGKSFQGFYGLSYYGDLETFYS